MSGATSHEFCQDFITLGFVDSQTLYLIAFSIYCYIAFSRFLSPSIISPSHFSNSHKIIPSTKSCLKFGSSTIHCQRKCIYLFFSCCLCLLIIILDSKPIHHLLATVVLVICHILSSAMSFPAKLYPKLFNHSTYESLSVLSIILATVFACFLISL